MNIFEIKPKVNRDKLKKKNKHSINSLYRDYPHITVRGRGVISKLRKGKK